MQKQDGLAKQPEVTLWQVYSAQEIMDADMGSTTADVVVVFGACEDITSKTVLVGSLPWQSDTAGCAISSELAFSLWGSTNVLGMQIKIEGRYYMFVVYSMMIHQGYSGRQRRNPVIHCQICS